jgi:stage IV sporulation protein FB
MIFLEPQRTPYDLNWRMLGVNIRVHPMFWLVSAIMGFSFLQRGFDWFLVWVACLFVSILIHELGHVFMFRVFGIQADAILYAFGGLAVPHHHLHGRWRRIAVSFAGPLAGFLLLGSVVLGLIARDTDNIGRLTDYALSLVGVEPAAPLFFPMPELMALALRLLIWINLFWGLLNLLPIWPLDGGRISYDLLDELIRGGKGRQIAMTISLALAAILTLHCILSVNGTTLIPFLPRFGSMFTVIMFGMMAIQSFDQLQRERNRPWREEW